VLSETILAVLNTNLHVYQAAPFLTLVEKETAKALANLFGLKGKYAGGLTMPGGSASNSSAIAIARAVKYPDVKEEGNMGREFVIFTSEKSHYSIIKAAQMFGIGSKGVVKIATDSVGRMKVDALEAAIAKAREDKKSMFIVVATAGTTVLGAYDPIDKIADVCDREGLWLHVDGCWGGSFIFSEKLRQGRLDGIHRADSIVINPHKQLGVPVTCSFLLSKDLREFHQGMKIDAP